MQFAFANLAPPVLSTERYRVQQCLLWDRKTTYEVNKRAFPTSVGPTIATRSPKPLATSTFLLRRFHHTKTIHFAMQSLGAVMGDSTGLVFLSVLKVYQEADTVTVLQQFLR